MFGKENCEHLTESAKVRDAGVAMVKCVVIFGGATEKMRTTGATKSSGFRVGRVISSGLLAAFFTWLFYDNLDVTRIAIIGAIFILGLLDSFRARIACDSLWQVRGEIGMAWLKCPLTAISRESITLREGLFLLLEKSQAVGTLPSSASRGGPDNAC